MESCSGCFKKFKDELYKAFKVNGVNHQVRIVTTDQFGNTCSFGKSHYFKLEVIEQNYRGKFSLENLDFQELSDSIHAVYIKNNRRSGETTVGTGFGRKETPSINPEDFVSKELYEKVLKELAEITKLKAQGDIKNQTLENQLEAKNEQNKQLEQEFKVFKHRSE